MKKTIDSGRDRHKERNRQGETKERETEEEGEGDRERENKLFLGNRAPVIGTFQEMISPREIS